MNNPLCAKRSRNECHYIASHSSALSNFSPHPLIGICVLPKIVSTTLPALRTLINTSRHTKSPVDLNLNKTPLENVQDDKMCYKETLYYGKCGCYSKPQFVGQPCIRVEVDTNLRSTGCWDVIDMGVQSLNTMCSKCEVAESLSLSTTGQSSPGWSGSDYSSTSSSSGSRTSSGSSASSWSTSSEESKRSVRAQACVSLSGMATYKARCADGGIDRSTTAFKAFHQTDGMFWTSESHKTPYVDTMYSRAPKKGRVAGLSSSQE